MNETFKGYIDQLEAKVQLLLSAEAHNPRALPRNMPAAGIYLFSEGHNHLYVGRSKNLRRRLLYHCSGNFTVASFAFLLARIESGNCKATYVYKGSRSYLQGQPEFCEAFGRCTERIRGMQVRYVEELDPIGQALLEIYAAVSLNTPYNKFETT